jgi:8-oxo-dGTP pyrophosphatase MutT (NUDIX family)
MSLERTPGTATRPAGAEALLARFAVLHPPVSTAGAAVTIVLRDGSSEVETLLIERTVSPEDPASGNVALPGGRVEGNDGSLAATALRELNEEVGLGASDLVGPLRFVGASLARRFGLHVGVFAACLAPTAGPPRIGSPEEVAHVFWLPRSALEATRLVGQQIDGAERRVLATVHDNHVVWGFTRRILREFFELPSEDGTDGPAFAHPPPPPG